MAVMVSSSHRLSTTRHLCAVFAGGCCGTILRVLLSTLTIGWLGKGWPYDILALNLTGALLLAFVTTLADATFLIGPTRRLLINTGFLGAYTTFSSLALGDILLFSKGAWFPALLYLMVSLGGGIGAVLGGDWLGQALIAYVRRTSQESPTPLGPPEPAGHIDIQDDRLLADQKDELQSRMPSRTTEAHHGSCD
jgi:CrcB protein